MMPYLNHVEHWLVSHLWALCDTSGSFKRWGQVCLAMVNQLLDKSSACLLFGLLQLETGLFETWGKNRSQIQSRSSRCNGDRYITMQVTGLFSGILWSLQQPLCLSSSRQDVQHWDGRVDFSTFSSLFLLKTQLHSAFQATTVWCRLCVGRFWCNP